MQPRLARVRASGEAFSDLFEAARATGTRIGWLDLGTSLETPQELERVTSSGAFRAVAAAGGRVLSSKLLAGPPVIRDLVREHFTGCRLVLVRGDVDAPELSATPEGWRVRWPDCAERTFSTEAFVEELRRPRFP